MAKLFLSAAALSGFIAVSLGALGAHALKGRLTESLLHAFQTGVQYQFYHTLALMLVALLLQRNDTMAAGLQLSGGLFIAGMLLFSGSLYALALGAPKILGPLTPLGGLCLIGGWLTLLLTALKSQ